MFRQSFQRPTALSPYRCHASCLLRRDKQSKTQQSKAIELASVLVVQ